MTPAPVNSSPLSTKSPSMWRSIIFGGVDLPKAWHELALLLLRLHLGLTICINAGLPKIKAFPATDWFLEQVVELGLPFAGFFAFVGAWTEVLGGALLAIGLLTRPAAILLAIHFAVAAFMYHKVFPLVDLQIAHVLFWIFLALAALGSGRWSLDRLIRRPR